MQGTRATTRRVVHLAWAALLAAAVCQAAPAFAQRAPLRDDDRKISRYVCSWQELQQQRVVMQQRDYSCGAAALATVARYFWGDDVDEEFFLQHVEAILQPGEVADRIEYGLTMTDLKNGAERAGYELAMGKLTYQQLTESKVPLVVGLSFDDFRHFVVVRGTFGGWVYLADPIQGNRRLAAGEFRQQWQQNAVLAIAKPGMDLPKVSRLRVCYDETILGWLNGQMVRRQLHPPRPFSIFRAP